MLVSGEFKDKAEFAAYNRYEIPENEAYAANCIWVNDKVLVPDVYKRQLLFHTAARQKSCHKCPKKQSRSQNNLSPPPFVHKSASLLL